METVIAMTAISVAIILGLSALAVGIGMGLLGGRFLESAARQPERGELDRGELLEEDPDRVQDVAHARNLLAYARSAPSLPMNG